MPFTRKYIMVKMKIYTCSCRATLILKKLLALELQQMTTTQKKYVEKKALILFPMVCFIPTLLANRKPKMLMPHFKPQLENYGVLSTLKQGKRSATCNYWPDLCSMGGNIFTLHFNMYDIRSNQEHTVDCFDCSCNPCIVPFVMDDEGSF